MNYEIHGEGAVDRLAFDARVMTSCVMYGNAFVQYRHAPNGIITQVLWPTENVTLTPSDGYEPPKRAALDPEAVIDAMNSYKRTHGRLPT